MSLPRTPESRAFSARITSWLHRPSSARTLPHRSSSACALPRRKLRSSAAWLACRSRICSTSPACPCSAHVSRCEFLCCQSLAACLCPNPAHPTPAPARLRRALLCAAAAHTAPPARAPTAAAASALAPLARARRSSYCTMTRTMLRLRCTRSLGACRA
jgi:hypothetical protein